MEQPGCKEKPGPITHLLNDAGSGDKEAQRRLWAAIYDELRRMARQQLDGDGAGRRLQPTSLVHEAYLRLVGNGPVEWANHRHFFAAAAETMRRICVDDARKRGRLKRGGGHVPQPLDTEPAVCDRDPAEVVAIDVALRKLEVQHPRKAQVVLLRVFGGLTADETARALELSRRTVEYDWRFARAWLHQELAQS